MLITYIKISFKIFGLYWFLAVSLHSLRKRKRSAKIAKKKFFEKKFSKNLEGIRKRYYLCTTFASQKAQDTKRDHWNN